MDSRYLQENPLSLLLETGSPSVRYLVKRDLQGVGGDYDSLLGDPAVAALLTREKKGIIGSRRRFDLYYRGAHWFLAAAVEYGLDLLDQFSVSHLSLTGRSRLPGIIAAGRYTKCSAQRSDRISSTLISDELEPHDFGCEKMATAFFKMSRSCRRVAFSRSS